MGATGVCPAYDRFFKKGIKLSNNLGIGQTFSVKSLAMIYEYIQTNKYILTSLQKKIKAITQFKYPLVKIVDTYFWLKGNDAN